MSDMATTLALREAIDRQTDDLIRAAARQVGKLRDSPMEKSQIRNLVNVAAGTISIEAVTNFIRYQIGRDTKNKTWRSGDFGKAVIEDIETGAIPAALQAVKQSVPAADEMRARADLTALYLGYLNRCFVYAKETGDWQNLSSGAGAPEGQ